MTEESPGRPADGTTGYDGTSGAASPAARDDAKEPGTTRARLLAVLVTVLVIAFLEWAAVALMPLAFAVFLVILAWPLQVWLEQRLPRWAAYALTLLAMAALLGLFIGALWWSGEQVAAKAPQYGEQVAGIWQDARAWAAERGFELPQTAASGSAAGELGRRLVKIVYSSVSILLLIIALVVLGLLEVHAFRRKAEVAFRHDTHSQHLVATVERIVEQYQRYLWARTLMAVIQGVVSGGVAWALGLDFAFVWGLLSFLLNFIPTVGSVLAVIPPTLFALVQFDGYGRVLAVLVGLALAQIVLGNYVDPKIQGRFLSLSPVVVLFSIVFWGWVWGVAGALLGVPIMVGMVIACDHFPQTRWIARLLVAGDDERVTRENRPGTRQQQGVSEPDASRLESEFVRSPEG